MKRETWFNNEIPQSWEVTRLKNVIISVKNGIWGDEPLNNSDDIECVRIADFDRKKNIVKDKEFTLRNIPKIQSENYLLKKGDLLIEKSGGGEKQPVGFVVQYNLDKKAVYANFMAKIELNSQKVDSTFINYVFSSLYAVKANLKAFNQTTGIQNLNTSVYLNEVFMYPSLNVQKNIVNFLNKKIQAIDETINKKQKMVELLEQQRQSIITEAVTKGLNPNAKMKDSGVEWIGEIPEYWEVNKIKFKFDIRKVIQPTENPTVLSLTQRGLKIKDLNDFSGQHADSYDKYQKVEIKDYVMNGMDLLTGYVDCSRFEGVTSPDYRVFRIKDNTECHDYYLRYFQMCYFSKIFYGHGQGVSNFGRWRLQTDVFKEFPIPVPPKDEQFKVSEFLKAKEMKIDKALELINLDIEKLKEYRKSLIYEAVTGKIDVRDMELD
ncbi:type I restriction-modification system specificity determinant [Bacillus subtilis subsp. subtilis str. RO-NN-1]|uniref:restriction endonuclease subunit S n=1 Tax=Bacillus subtilis TaxID=1423 RepID=UPI00022BA7D7|nr:restriction endonuclease subunit S [Bacillus subtilis]AEP89763.1 type I restriction-modification system specificity determinant [Bacillus subtilis subsp. subtilis str. RO-NN-1]UVZ58666.1 restriction endonuclease subunit S [Bacillus subtilis]